jgi:hypothetical protein
MAAYAHYGVDEGVVLRSFLPIYTFDEADGVLSIDEIEVLPEVELERLTGIRLIKKRESSDLFGEIIKAVDREIPMLAACDSYAMPWRRDVYETTHIIHWLLVYGYDKRKGTVVGNENDHNGTSRYTEMELLAADLERITASFRAHLLKRGSFGIVKVKRIGRPSAEPVPGYGALVKPFAAETGRSVEALERFLAYFAETSGGEAFQAKGEELRTALLNIRYKKEAQRYQISALYGDGETRKLTERIVQATIFLCGVLYKLKITGKCSEESKGKLRERMAEWLECEKRLCVFLVGEDDTR